MLSAHNAHAAFEAKHALLAMVIVALVARRHAGRKLGQHHLEVALGLGRQHLDLGGVPADVDARTLPDPHDVERLLLLHDQVGHRGLQREGQVADALIQRWARSKDRWWRRAALVSTVALNIGARGGQGDPARTLMVCRGSSTASGVQILGSAGRACRAPRY